MPPRTAPPAERISTLPSPLANEERRFFVSAGAAIALQPGGPGVDLTLRGRWMPVPQLGVGAIVGVPVVGSTVQRSEGSASLSASLFGGELSLVALPTGPVRLAASLGLAAAWLKTYGFANPPYRGQPSDTVVALPMAGVEVAPRMGERTYVVLNADVGFSFPRADVAFAGAAVATWGRPLGLVSAGLGIDL
jgi:hypothetical protein